MPQQFSNAVGRAEEENYGNVSVITGTSSHAVVVACKNPPRRFIHIVRLLCAAHSVKVPSGADPVRMPIGIFNNTVGETRVID